MPLIRPVPEWFIDNGCGPERFEKLVPDWGFEKACREHDWDYFAGGSEADREEADWLLLMAMLKTARVKWWRVPRAFLYWRAVRVGGASHFSYRKNPLTLKELQAIHDG